VKELSGKKLVDYVAGVLTEHSEKEVRDYFPFAEEALVLSKKIGYKSGEADILFEMSMMYFTLEEFRKSLDCGVKALNIRKQFNDKSKIARSYTYLAINYEYFGKYDSATSFLFKAVKLAEESKSQKELANAYNALGILNYVLKNYQSALEYTDKALVIRETIGDKRGIMSSLENFGLIYMNLKEYDKAISYHTKILNIKKEIGSKEEIAGTLDNLGICHMRLKNYTKALSYYNESLAIRKTTGGKRALSSSYSQLGTLYSLQGNHAKSLEFLLQSYNLRKEMSDNRGMISSLKKIMAEYEVIGDFVNAYKYSQLYHSRNDSTFNENSIRQINELDSRFKSKLKDREISLLQKDIDIEKKNRILYIAAVVLATLIAVFYFFSAKTKKRTNLLLLKKNEEISKQKEELSLLNSKLKKSNTDKDKLFSIIAHDLKNPFTALLGLSEILKFEFVSMSDDDKLKMINGIYDSSRNTYRLLENLLQWSRLQTGRIEFNPEEVDLYKTVVDAVELFKASASAKGIIFRNELVPGIIAYCDNFMINTVLRNLLSNAIKFSHTGGKVIISSKPMSDSVQLEISDNGIGMSDSEIHGVFEIDKVMVKKGTSNEEGTGLGLILCKEFIKKNRGEIWISSQQGKGSSFFIKLPVNGAKV
jgi:signal transduction histidine kinase